MNLNKQQRHSDLDNYWLETLLCLIGEAFDEQSDDICGAVVNIRGKGNVSLTLTHLTLRKEKGELRIIALRNRST